MKKVLFFIFVSVLMISNVSALKITSLGDSIPNGVLLDDKEKSYDNRIAKTLNAELDEYSKSGIITEDLLKMLDKQDVIESIKSSDIVFINIGSGDLLDLTDYLDFKKFGFDSNTNLDLKSPESKKVIAYIQETFIKELEPKTDSVINGFKQKFKTVIEKIKSYNPNVKIYVNSAYNPFFNISIPILLDLKEVEKATEEAIKKFNDILKESDEYQIIDIYDVLRNNDYLNIDPLSNSFDPHPNELGHEKIYEKYLEELCYKITYDDKDYYILKGDTFNIEPKEKEEYTFVKWNYDLNNINQNIVLKEVYKKNINYLLFIIPGGVLLLVIIFIIIKKRK